MAKKLNIFTSVVLGAVGGVAAAVFLASESGKRIKKQVTDFVKDYQENHDEINAEWVGKAQDLKEQSVDKFGDVKRRLESGELTIDDLLQSGKEKVQDLTEQIKDKFADNQEFSETSTVDEVQEDFSVEVPEEDIVVQDDIEIDL